MNVLVQLSLETVMIVMGKVGKVATFKIVLLGLLMVVGVITMRVQKHVVGVPRQDHVHVPLQKMEVMIVLETRRLLVTQMHVPR